MISIYKRLLKYQESDIRSNLENYLTEVLCDYLNRLSNVDIKSFIRGIVFHQCKNTCIESFFKVHPFDGKKQNIEWKTQYSINVSGTIKYPDLLGFINKKPAILVEVKIDAGFTERIHQDVLGNEVITPQLKDYGNWLNYKNPDGVLVLLSHLTTPPDDYLETTGNYGVKLRNYIKWQQIYNWLKEQKHNSKPCLTNDFINFLRECNMAIESPNSIDLSVLEIFVSGAGETINNMMKFTREELEKKFIKNMNWGKEKSYLTNDGLYAIDYKQKAVWSWVLLDSKEYSYIGWGICYPNENNAWGWKDFFPNLPKKPFVFIGLFSDKEQVQTNYINSIKLRPEDWLWNNDIENDEDSDLIGIKYRDLNKFVAYDSDITINFYEFVHNGFKDIEKLVDKIVI